MASDGRPSVRGGRCGAGFAPCDAGHETGIPASRSSPMTRGSWASFVEKLPRSATERLKDRLRGRTGRRHHVVEDSGPFVTTWCA